MEKKPHNGGIPDIEKKIKAIAYAQIGFTEKRLEMFERNKGVKVLFSKTLNVSSRLKERIEASPEEFTNALLLREAFYGKSGASPVGSVDNVPSGAYFLKEVTKEGGRVYERK